MAKNCNLFVSNSESFYFHATNQVFVQVTGKKITSPSNTHKSKKVHRWTYLVIDTQLMS